MTDTNTVTDELIDIDELEQIEGGYAPESDPNWPWPDPCPGPTFPTNPAGPGQ